MWRGGKTVISSQTINDVIESLKGWYKASEWWRYVDYSPFQLMIAISMSQRTFYKQVAKFMEIFRFKYKTPEDIIKASPFELQELCKLIGMARRRALLIQQLAKIISDIGGMDSFLKLPPEKARKMLINVKGIGEKTADMILVALFNEKYFIVDSNILRVLKRLGLVPIDSNIYKAREIVEPLIPLKHRVFLHTALVSLGQRICKPSKPSCRICPLHELCPYYKNTSW